MTGYTGCDRGSGPSPPQEGEKLITGYPGFHYVKGGKTAGAGKIFSQKRLITIVSRPMMMAMTVLFLCGSILTIVAFAEGIDLMTKYLTIAAMDAGFNGIILFVIGLGVGMSILLFVVQDHNRTARRVIKRYDGNGRFAGERNSQYL